MKNITPLECDITNEQSKENLNVRSALQRRVVNHNVKQFFESDLQICRICLETEDDSKGTATLNPITSIILNFLKLEKEDFPRMICTRCERTVVDYMILLEMCQESNIFIKQVKDELEMNIGSDYIENFQQEFKNEYLLDNQHSEITNFSEPNLDLYGENAIHEEQQFNEERDTDKLVSTVDESIDEEQIFTYDSKLDLKSPRIANRNAKSHTYEIINDKFVCLFCGKMCDSERSHKSHVTTSHKKPHLCPVLGCNKSFGLPTMVRRHIKQVHADYFTKTGDLDDATSLMQYNEKFKCSHCEQTFKQKRHLDTHIKKEHVEINLICKVCKKPFSPTRLKVHMKIHEKAFECNECGKRFVDKFLLKKHLLTIHLGIHTYLCSQCGSNFGTSQTLRRHKLKVHSNETNLDDRKGCCKFCFQRFDDTTELIKHVKEHTHTLRCKVCAKRFASEVSLKHHENNHKNVEHPYQCRVCNSRYATKVLLKKHLDHVHIDQKWFCSYCKKILATSKALEVHEKLHEGIKEYKCFLCKKEFAATRRLREHLIAYHTKSRYQCPKCDLRCITIRGIEAHIRKHHYETFELQPDMSLYFQKDEPNYTEILSQYNLWLKKTSKIKQEAKR